MFNAYVSTLFFNMSITNKALSGQRVDDMVPPGLATRSIRADFAGYLRYDESIKIMEKGLVR